MRTITLSLISHTNVGKTTLARTLLRRDVGEVLDQAHVTEVSEAHELIVSEDARLLLWDTPGLGDSARLVRRLRTESNPVGWILHQVWDRNRDRPLYSSQEAARNIKEDADVVLYLVNASEDPEDAGYVAWELELLGWIGKPVIVLLNQTGEADPGTTAPVETRTPLEEATARGFASPSSAAAGDGVTAASPRTTWADPGAPAGAGAEAPVRGRAPARGNAEAVARWDAAMRDWPIVRHVLPLDAFTRCWVQEGLLLSSVVSVLEEPARSTMRELADVWQRRNLAVFDESAARIGTYLAAAAADHETLPAESAGRAEKRRAMRSLTSRLDEATRTLMEVLLDLHGLKGRFQEEARTRLAEDFRMPGEIAWSSGGAAILGAAMGGAAGGLAADVLTGGLSFGAGAIAGALLGAAGAAGLLRGFQLVAGAEAPVVRWSHEFLRDLTQQTLLRYLAVAHFGRGRGEWRDLGNPARWSVVVEKAIAARADRLARYVADARDDSGLVRDPSERMGHMVREVLRDILSTAYPQAAHFLR